MITQTEIEWKKEGKEKFGDDFNQWKFKCPACGHVSNGNEFKQYGGDVNDAFQNCIGRFNGNGNTHGEDEGHGCNWAAYGLFGTLGKGRSIKTDQSEIEVFDYAEIVMNVTRDH